MGKLEHNKRKTIVIDWLLILVPLVLGAAIYICLSPKTYISILFWKVLGIDNPFHKIKMSEMPGMVRFVRFYLCDFFWAFALFQAVFMVAGKKRLIVMTTISLVFCVSLEVLQMTSLIPGTFDFFDILAEALAGGIATASVIARKKKESQNA